MSSYPDGRALPRRLKKPEWVKEIRHVRVVTVDAGETIHRNPHCNQRTHPTVTAIMWRSQIVEIPTGDETFTVHQPGRFCPSCVKWAAVWDDWQSHAACAGLDIDEFFPKEGFGQVEDPSYAFDQCRRCPVATACLRTALRNQLSTRSDFGIWGGTDRGVRARLRGILRAYTAGEEETTIELVTITGEMGRIVDVIRHENTIRVLVDPISKVRHVVDRAGTRYDSRSFAGLERRSLVEHVGYDHGFQVWTLAKRLRIDDDV